MEFNAGSVSVLRRQFGGGIVAASDESYEAARRVWNAMIDRRPAFACDRPDDHRRHGRPSVLGSA